jgi:hypothetical protein
LIGGSVLGTPRRPPEWYLRHVYCDFERLAHECYAQRRADVSGKRAFRKGALEGFAVGLRLAIDDAEWAWQVVEEEFAAQQTGHRLSGVNGPGAQACIGLGDKFASEFAEDYPTHQASKLAFQHGWHVGVRQGLSTAGGATEDLLTQVWELEIEMSKTLRSGERVRATAIAHIGGGRQRERARANEIRRLAREF